MAIRHSRCASISLVIKDNYTAGVTAALPNLARKSLSSIHQSEAVTMELSPWETLVDQLNQHSRKVERQGYKSDRHTSPSPSKRASELAVTDSVVHADCSGTRKLRPSSPARKPSTSNDRAVTVFSPDADRDPALPLALRISCSLRYRLPPGLLPLGFLLFQKVIFAGNCGRVSPSCKGLVGEIIV